MRYLLTIISLFITSFCISQNHLIISDDTDNGWQYRVPYSSYYYSENDTLSIDSILAHPKAYEFKKSEGNIINDEHYTDRWFWVKLEIENKSNFSSDWLIDFETKYFKLHEIAGNNTYRIHQSGRGYKSKEKDFIHGNVNFVKINLPGNSISTYYIQLKGFWHETINGAKMIKAKPIEEKFKRSNYWMGTFMGIMLLILITNFILYWSSKDKTYLIYSAYVFLFTLLCLSIKGTLFELFFPNSLWINNDVTTISLASLTLILYAVFANSYLQLKQKNISWYKIIRFTVYISIVLHLLMILLLLSGFFYSAKLIILYWTLIVFVLCNIPAIIQWRKKFQPSGMFFLGNLILISGQLLFLLLKTGGGVEDNTFSIHYYLEISLICQVIIFSKGIGDRINIMRKKSEEAQEKAMLQLEEKVALRTNELNEKKVSLEIKNKEVNDSISYAKRIQNAILPPFEKLKNHFPDSLILYLPKDIVAGDFYWLEETNDSILFAVADCTGHGVPGAMVSVVCNNALNRAVNEYKITEPSLILNKTRELVTETFSKNTEHIKDGMDISLISYNTANNQLTFSGANNGIYIIRNNALNHVKADKQPIGIADTYTSYSSHEIKIEKNDCLFMFSDGFADQFGGENDKKLKSSNFKKLLLENHQLKMIDQKKELLNFFNKWKNQTEQLDDVCVVGIRF